jgi:hypothetical protein
MPTDNTMDFQMMCELLTNLLNLSEYLWEQGKDLNGSNLKNGTTMINYEMMNWAKPHLTSRELGSLVEKSRNSYLHLERFYLPPLDEDREFIPILSLDCKFGSSPPSLNLRVGMTKYANGGNGQPVSVGFRFEMGKHASNHNYHHMQLTAKPHDEPLLGCPELPETYPCVPTPAKCPFSLILCMLISLYGSGISRTEIFPAELGRKYKVPYDYFL